MLILGKPLSNEYKNHRLYHREFFNRLLYGRRQRKTKSNDVDRGLWFAFELSDLSRHRQGIRKSEKEKEL